MRQNYRVSFYLQLKEEEKITQKRVFEAITKHIYCDPHFFGMESVYVTKIDSVPLGEAYPSPEKLGYPPKIPGKSCFN